MAPNVMEKRDTNIVGKKNWLGARDLNVIYRATFPALRQEVQTF